MAMQLKHILAGIGSRSFKKNRDAVIKGVAILAMKSGWGSFARLQLALG
jgi:hypothetical protein